MLSIIQDVAEKLADAIKNSSVDLVPKTVVNMGGEGNNGEAGSATVMDTLLKFITVEKLGVNLQGEAFPKQNEEETDLPAAQSDIAVS